MKKLLLIVPVIAFFLFAFTSCLKDKNYTCECTYVPSATGPNAGEPNKTETAVVKGRIREDADFDCFSLEGKYINQFYSGTCLIK